MSLSNQEILVLLKGENRNFREGTPPNEFSAEYKPTYPPNNVDGPVKWFEKAGSCMRRRCGSPTHFKMRGVYTCSTHILFELNEEIARAQHGVD